MEKWQLETAERLASIERSLKYIEENLKDLPLSTAAVLADQKLEHRITRLEKFQKDITVRIAWVSGAFAVIASGLFSAFDFIKNLKF
jgi:hypothetical protein